MIFQEKLIGIWYCDFHDFLLKNVLKFSPRAEEK